MILCDCRKVSGACPTPDECNRAIMEKAERLELENAALRERNATQAVIAKQLKRKIAELEGGTALPRVPGCSRYPSCSSAKECVIERRGGILDRIDSLCFAAPIFFHLARFYFAP